MSRTKTPVKKPARRATYRKLVAGLGHLLLKVGEGPKATLDNYHVEHLPSDFGRAFRLTKFPAECDRDTSDEYLVCIDVGSEDGGPRHHCDCLGFIRWCHCKHVESLLALHHAGRL